MKVVKISAPGDIRVDELFFSLPLYSPKPIQAITGLFRSKSAWATAEGHCPHCQIDRVFSFQAPAATKDVLNPFNDLPEFVSVDLFCAKDESHKLTFWLNFSGGNVQKVGQRPSIADISVDQMRTQYKSVLRGDNWPELYKAIGLAAHGEGIGAFVYLRRVFERLIRSRFDEVKGAEGWNDEQFNVRMEDRIDLLKSHLPTMLVESRKIYGIFSLGIHELDNDRCLEFFPIGKESIIMILEEDLRAKQDKERKALLQKEIFRFDTKNSADAS